MSGTDRSEAGLPGMDLGGRRRSVVVLAAELLLAWAFVLLWGWIGAVGLIGAGVGLWLNSFLVDDAEREQRRVVGAALRAHADPGPAHRPAVDAAATQRLAASAVDRWGAPAVSVLVAAACAGTAVFREDPVVALPVLPLLALAWVADASRRRQEALAFRWITDPPASAEADR
ncbi:MAG: hypothetical protein JHC71_03275 [Blastococcus sp.]|nr:hypothetical protein [Blastococcus sp.]